MSAESDMQNARIVKAEHGNPSASDGEPTTLWVYFDNGRTLIVSHARLRQLSDTFRVCAPEIQEHGRMLVLGGAIWSVAGLIKTGNLSLPEPREPWTPPFVQRVQWRTAGDRAYLEVTLSTGEVLRRSTESLHVEHREDEPLPEVGIIAGGTGLRLGRVPWSIERLRRAGGLERAFERREELLGPGIAPADVDRMAQEMGMPPAWLCPPVPTTPEQEADLRMWKGQNLIPQPDEPDEKRETWRAIREAVRGYQRSKAEPAPQTLVERTLACPTCRREFCKVHAPPAAVIAVVCPGCAAEGRAVEGRALGFVVGDIQIKGAFAVAEFADKESKDAQ